MIFILTRHAWWMVMWWSRWRFGSWGTSSQLTGINSCNYTETWKDHCQWCPYTLSMHIQPWQPQFICVELALINYSTNANLGMFRLRMTGCDDHVQPCYFCIRTRHSSSVQTSLRRLDYGTWGELLYGHATKSCDMQLWWNSFMHSEHSCGTHRCAWRALSN